jgi:TPR repeat protein
LVNHAAQDHEGEKSSPSKRSSKKRKRFISNYSLLLGLLIVSLFGNLYFIVFPSRKDDNSVVGECLTPQPTELQTINSLSGNTDNNCHLLPENVFQRKIAPIWPEKESVEPFITLRNAEEGYRYAMETLVYWQETNDTSFQVEIHRRFLFYEREEQFFHLGWCHEWGISVPKNITRAMEFYQLAITREKNPQAMTRLGYLLDRSSVEESFRLYEAAAALEETGAMNYLGLWYLGVLGNSSSHFHSNNYSTAFFWYQKASQLGNSNAMTNLAVMYQQGIGMRSKKKDIPRAIYYYQLAAESGNRYALNNLGIIYKYGLKEDHSDKDSLLSNNNKTERILIRQDYQEARRLFQLATERGHTGAMNNLAILYHHGLGVEMDWSLAFHWYRIAAEKGNQKAIYNLGICYENGIGVEIDPVEANRLYAKAAEKGIEKAKEKLLDQPG